VIVPVAAAAAFVVVARVQPDPRDLAEHDAVASAASGRRPSELLAIPAFRAAALAAVVGQMAMVGVMGVTPSEMDAMHHPGMVISLVISTHITGMFAFGPLIGRWMDRTSTRRTMLTGCGVSLGGALLATSESSAVVIGLGLFAIGIGWSATFLAVTATISDVTEPGERAGALGFTDLTTSLTSAVGGLGAGVVLHAAGFRTLGIVVAAVVAAVAMVVARLSAPRAKLAGETVPRP
jgi:MFS family permease